MKKQTLEERTIIKKVLIEEYGEASPTAKKIAVLDDTTKVTELESGKVFTCVEIQLKGCLVENGIRRRYLSYADLENYDVSN